MENTDDALEAEWLSPDDLIEIDDDEERRISDIHALREVSVIKALREERRISDVRALRAAPSAPEARPSRDEPRALPSRSKRAPARVHAAIALLRLALFFMLGLGLGSIFALGVATVLEIRKDSTRVAPVHAPMNAIDSTAAEAPDFGKPGRAL